MRRPARNPTASKLITGGNNAYPENSEQFLDWLDALFPELEFVDRKRLERWIRLSLFPSNTDDRKISHGIGCITPLRFGVYHDSVAFGIIKVSSEYDITVRSLRRKG